MPVSLCSSYRPRPPRPRAFTLVEIVVVLAIVALLSAILLPSLARARGSGRAASSMSNLRQMTIAAHQYATYFDAWPAAIRYEHDGAFTTVAWDWAQANDGTGEPGPLWQFTDHPTRVMQCPEFHGHSTFGSDPFTGYNYNTSYLGGEATFPQVGWDAVRPGLRPHVCERMSTTAIFGAVGAEL